MESRKGEKIIVLVDMDCFYVQVEQKLCPEYLNKPCAVVQYNAWKGGGIIAVNYEARAKGVSRRHRGEDALKLCPEIHLFKVPEVRGKADLTRYREAGASVIEVLCKFSNCVERASIDEAYLDLTEAIKVRMQNYEQVSGNQIPNTFVIGWEDKEDQKGALENWLQTINEEDHLYHDRMLSVAAVVVEEMREAVYAGTGYRCSAGIAHNKTLAKLTCGLHKPNKQTVLPEAAIPILYQTIPVNKVRNLGGKLGEQVMEKLQAKMMSNLLILPKSQFINNFGEKNGNWLYDLSRGIENEPVTPRQLPKSIGCGKNFPGKSSLSTKEKVAHWVKQLSTELEERLLKDQENNCRVAKLLTVTVRNQVTPGYSTVSRSCPIHVYCAEKIAHDALAALQKFNTSPQSSTTWVPSIFSLAMSAGKFEDEINHSTCDIQSYFSNKISPQKKTDLSIHQSSSAIDTVVNLLDADSELANTSNESVISNVWQGSVLKKSTQPSKGISSFFSVKTPSTSTSCKDVDLNSSGSTLTCEKEVSLLNEVPLSKDIQLNTSNSASESKDTVCEIKGFFARKLKEQTKDYKATKDTTDASCSSTACALNENAGIQPVIDETRTILDPELTKLCSKCNQQIPIWEEEEHADYHMALDLSKEFVKDSSMTNASSKNSVTQSKPFKVNRKRGNVGKPANKGKKPAQQNTIDSFFR